jgi:hypothetical protein
MVISNRLEKINFTIWSKIYKIVTNWTFGTVMLCSLELIRQNQPAMKQCFSLTTNQY